MLGTKSKERIKSLLTKLPYIGKALKDYETFKLKYPPGHYYSPIVDRNEIRQDYDRLFSNAAILNGIDLNKEEQYGLLQEFIKYYDEIPFSDQKKEGLRYYFDNNFYVYSDAIFLYSIIRHFKPQQIIEAGSGFSSSVMLDTNDLFFEKKIKLTFIEPYPERLLSLLNKEDKATQVILQKRIQDVPVSEFNKLNRNDILFIDSTHVAKTGSDLNYILFEVLPILKKGVIIHFHDIFYPFEYPKEWVLHWDGFGWNEIYFLRAFLTNNNEYKIINFNTYLHKENKDWLSEKMPMCLKFKESMPGSIWIQKV